jgi:hypothetical protein
VPFGEKIRRYGREIIPLGAEVVVDDVEKDGEAADMAGLDELLQILGPAITGRRSVKKGSVIAPVSGSRELGDRHQFDRGRAQPADVIEMSDRTGEITLLREGAEVDFVQHDLFPGAPAPAVLGPAVGRGIDDFARPVDAVGLSARCRVRIGRSVYDIAVARAGNGASGGHGEPALGFANHWQDFVGELQRDRTHPRRP